MIERSSSVLNVTFTHIHETIVVAIDFIAQFIFSTLHRRITGSIFFPGTYSAGGLAACVSCPAGLQCLSTSSTLTLPCPFGTYSPDGQAGCTDCEAGYSCVDPAAAHSACDPGKC